MDKRSDFDNGLLQSNIKTCTRQGAKTLARAAKYLLVALPLLTTQALAANIQWEGNTSTDWATATNWIGGVAPIAGDVAVFTGDPGLLTNANPVSDATVISGWLGSIDFSGASGAYSITNNSSMYLKNGISNTSGIVHTITNTTINSFLYINGPLGPNLQIDNAGTVYFAEFGSTPETTVQINNTGTVVFNPNLGTVTFAGNITGGLLQKVNYEGELILTGNNTPNLVKIPSNGGYVIVGDGAISGSLTADINTGSGISAVVFNRSDDIQYDNVVSGLGQLIQRGTGQLTLTADQTFTGTAIIENSNGALRLGDGTSNNGKLASSAIVDNGTLIYDHSNGSFVETSRIVGLGSVVKKGNDTLVFLANNAYVGDTSVNAGTLQVGDGNTTGFVTGDINLASGTQVIFNRSNDFNYSGVISGQGSLEKQGVGILGLIAVSTYEGDTRISAGTLRLYNSANLTNSNVILSNNAELSFYNSNTSVTYTGTITGNGTVSKASNARVLLTGENTFSGPLTILGGDLQLGDPADVSAGLTGSVTSNIDMQGGVLYFARSNSGNLDYSGVISGTRPIYQVGSADNVLRLLGENTNTGTLVIQSGAVSIGDGHDYGSYAGNIATNSQLIFDRSDDITYSSNINGSGLFTKKGGGTLTLLGTVSNGAGIDVADGTLEVSNGQVASGWVTVNMHLNNSNVVFNRLDNVTYADVISGMGDVEQRGTGPLVFSMDQQYTGNTLIAAASQLQLGANTVSGSVKGDITNNGQLTFFRYNDVVYDNVISGSGELIKIGGNTLTLTNSNTYTGTTTVNGGTLELGNGVSSGSIVSDKILLSSRLRFNSPDEVTYNGTIEGSGLVEKYGSGRLILNGVNHYRGGTLIYDGSLLVGGSEANSNAYLDSYVTVNPGATLGGFGKISSNVTNNGVVAPGASVGTLTILGDYFQNGNGTYRVDIEGDQSDHLQVSGRAFLAGNLELNVHPTGGFVPGQEYNILSSDVGVFGNFVNVNGLGQFEQHFLTVEVYTNPETRSVYLRPALNEAAITAVLETPNQRRFVDYLLANHNSTLVGMMANATTTEELLLGLEENNPVSYANQEYQLSQVSRWFETNVMDRMDVMPQCRAVSAKDTGCMTHPSLWITPYGSSATIDGNGNAPSMDTSLGGATIGADFPVANGAARLGVAFGASYFNSDSSDDSNASADGTLYQFGVYGNYHAKRWNLSASVALSGTDNINASRNVTLTDGEDSTSVGVDGSYSASVFSEQLRASYELAVKSAQFKPFVGLVNQNVSRDSFDETGDNSGLLVSVNQQDFNSLRSQVGASLEIPMKSVTFLASAAWQHEFEDTQGQISASFVEDADQSPQSYNADGVDIGRDSASLEAGFILVNKDKIKVSVLYQGNFADSYSENGGKLQLDFNLS